MTKNISVNVKTLYLPEKSIPERNRFMWSYEVTIQNNDEEIVQLLNRYWEITTMMGEQVEVKGPGVTGLQPLIKPNKQFSYVSYCELTTPKGSMKGYYEMQNLNDEHFLIEIPKFILTAPNAIGMIYGPRLH